IAGWDDFPLAAWLSEQLGVPAVLGNDADVAGLAEALFGAGKGLSPIFYVTIGSGIGGGFIINGEIYRGTGRGAAEIGHLLVNDPDNPGKLVALEEVASGWSIAQRARRLLNERRGLSQPKSPLHDLCSGQLDKLTPQHVAQAAALNDPVAQSILDTAVDA